MGRKPTYAELEKRVMDLEQSSLSRSRAKGALRKYDLIFSAIEDPMGYIDSTYTCLAINNVFLAALNKTRQEIVGHTLDKLLGRKTFEEKIRPHLDICLSGQKSYLEDWFEYPALGRHFLAVHFHPYFEDDGSVSGIAVVARENNTHNHNQNQNLRRLDCW